MMRLLHFTTTLLAMLYALASSAQVTKIDATRLLDPGGTSTFFLTNGSGNVTSGNLATLAAGGTGISVTGNTIDNTGLVSASDGSSIDFTVTGTSVTAEILGLAGASTGQVPSKSAGGGITWITPSSGGTVGPGGAFEFAYFNGTNSVTSSPNIYFDPTNIIVALGQPVSGTARLLVKGSSDTRGAYYFQGFNNGNTERIRLTNNGYFEGTGLSRINAAVSPFRIEAPLLQSYTQTATEPGLYVALDQSGVTWGPSSGSDIFVATNASPVINQTGTASGNTFGVRVNPTLTSVLGTWYGISVENTSGKGIFQTSTSVPNAFAGKVRIGSTTDPAISLQITGTDALGVPVGTTAERPGSPATGWFRFNTTTGLPEIYNSTGASWNTFFTSNVYSVSGTSGELAYFIGANSVTSAVAGKFDGTNMALGTTVVGGQRLTVMGGGNTNASNAMQVLNSTSGVILSARNDQFVGIGTSTLVNQLTVNSSIGVGTSLGNTTRASRALNVIDAAGVARIWRYSNTTTNAPSVELCWGNTGDTPTYYWDFFVDPASATAESFLIRRRTGSDNNMFRIRQDKSYWFGPHTVASVGAGAMYNAPAQVSVAGDIQHDEYLLYASSTNTSYSLTLDGTNQPDIDNGAATSRTWSVRVTIATTVTARTSGTPVVGDTRVVTYVGYIKKVSGVYTAGTFSEIASSGDANLNTLSAAFTVTAGGLFDISMTRPAGVATYRSTAKVEMQEICW